MRMWGLSRPAILARPLLAAAVVAMVWTPCMGADTAGDERSPEDQAYAAFQLGRQAYEQGNYLSAISQFERACDLALIFSSAYYVWLGTACEQAYDTAPDVERPRRLPLLARAVRAYERALDRKRDPDLQYDRGRLRTKWALACAERVLEKEVTGPPSALRSVPAQAQDTSLALSTALWAQRYEAAAVDTLVRLWGTTSRGLREMWRGILARERKERIYAFPEGGRTAASDTLHAYLSVYIEHAMKLAELASRVDFVGLEPDYYPPKIAAACRRGLSGPNAEWFARVMEAIRFDGGSNMRTAIHRVIGLRLSQDRKGQGAVEAMLKGIYYARSDTSKASLYIDMAFTAYRTNLSEAVSYARLAYLHNPHDERVRDTYGGLSLSLANAELGEGDQRRAIATLHPVTSFDWQDRGEALITLAIAYVDSDLPGVLDAAYQAAQEAYVIDPGRYWQEFRRIAELHGRFAQVMDLDRKHRNGVGHTQ